MSWPAKRLVICACLLAIVAGVSHDGPPPPGTALWESAPPDWRRHAQDRPPASAFQRTPWNEYAGGRVETRTQASGQSLRAIIDPAGYQEALERGNQRAERVPSLVMREGQVRWVGFDFMLEGPIGITESFQNVFQMKTGGDADVYPPLAITVNEREPGLRLVSNGQPRRSLGGPPEDVWTRIVVGVRVATDPDSAWVEAWRDGRRLVDRTDSWPFTNADGAPGGTMAAGGDGGNYLKFGIYRGPLRSRAVVRYRRIIVGTTREVVQ